MFVGLDEVIAANAQKLFPGMVIESGSQFRVCRDAEVELDDNGLSKRDMVELELQQRRFEPVVRLELQPNADPEMVAELRSRFSLAPEDIYEMNAMLDYTTLFEIAELPMPELRDPPWSPLPPLGLEQVESDIFTAIRRGDVLIHQPYDSFDAGVERFIREAADDPQTVSIKMTVYRVGDDTPFVQSLIRAAEAGKQVACVIELNARFDEARNLHWSRELEKVGAHVVFGLSGLKTHAKTALVVRQEGDGVRCYAHLATGNYHSRTARLYEDVGLLTADPRVTDDVVTLFHFLTGRSRTPEFSTLVVAPMAMRTQFVQLIQREIDNHRAGRPARIVCKMNQLEDPEMCLLLTRASQAGVPVDLIVRGLSCLAPGVPGLTENIRIRSIVGRFLEHSRIFHFAGGAEDPLDGVFLIGSGDWMHRNLSERVETAVPILERRLRARLWEILDISLCRPPQRLGDAARRLVPPALPGRGRGDRRRRHARGDDAARAGPARGLATATTGPSPVRLRSETHPSSPTRLWLVLVAALTVAAVAAGIAVAEKDKGNDKKFEYALGLWGPGSRVR